MSLENFVTKLSQYNPYLNMDRIIKAYQFGDSAHSGQLRKSGESYFTHPVQVSLILAELELDEDTIIAGLLHDVIEDTRYTFAELEKEFGRQVALLVDGVTKLGQIQYETKEEAQAENLRKMFLAMAKDIRVILIKLADRLHNMRTLKYMTDSKKKEKAQETLEIYAPIAHRLGISRLKWELEDLSFLYLDPEGYYDLVTKVNRKREERESYINSVIKDIRDSLKEVQIDCEIVGRPKNFYSIYKKMVYQNKNFEEIYDLTAIRVLVESIKDCYGVLGIVHNLWKPIPGRFKDYIAMPKPNLYQSLHTTVIGAQGEPFEIQIRTWEMHRIAEFGIAAHWKYKEGIENTSQDDMEKRLAWLRQMMEWQRDLNDPREFMESLKIDLFTNQVFVFTPNGEVIELPVGSTPVDFAYKIHSAVGNKCVGAKVNGRIVTLNYKLSNGQIIEILTSNSAQGPSRDWLKFVVSTQAKNKIRQWFKKERREENVDKGREMFEREVKRNGLQPKDLMKDEWLEPILSRLSLHTIDDMYAALGYGGIMLNQIVPKLREKYRATVKKPVMPHEIPAGGHVSSEIHEGRERKSKPSANGIILEGHDDILVRFAKCCSPVPGDEIIGYITRGRGVTIHRKDCTNFEKTEDANARFIEVEWDNRGKQTAYSSEIQIIAPDRKGLLGEITVLISEFNLTVTGVNAKLTKNNMAIIHLTVEINDSDQLVKLIKKIQNMPEIIEVKRVTS